ncbi:HAD hydrolase-like protein [Altererythrobacter salegens]|uniref:HAD hydrolase-like protein n=1 Tax=Croceibacterium salegens TaxID=1737568 RepID=A0A6I4SVU6_9SPHN|nr:HAD hydrolase-like protein [Croceibacterium salegens]MXO59469.1 HAD hydrolase-like protein [Croceibacterium salegens]
MIELPAAPPKGFMFDLDGTLILSDRKLGGYTVIPGAVEVLEELERRGVPFLALTNGSAYAASVQGPKLRGVGLPIRDERLHTPNSVAAKVFRDNGYASVLVLGTDGVIEALEGFGISCCRPGEEAAKQADAVYTAWHPGCNMDDIHAAAGRVLDGAAFYTASDVPFFATKDGPAFGYSCAINGAVARVTGVEPQVTGKPSQLAMDFLAAELGLAAHEIAVIGDDPKVETEMARGGGAIGVGVTSGTTSAEKWHEQPHERAPDFVIPSVAALLSDGWLG